MSSELLPTEARLGRLQVALAEHCAQAHAALTRARRVQCQPGCVTCEALTHAIQGAAARQQEGDDAR
jgi:hypothetical protein